jgi:hypothetical protein
MPLDGLWVRAPYLHNGSVPTLSQLLERWSGRSKVFYRGNDLYDPMNVGFVSTAAEDKGRQFCALRYHAGRQFESRGHEGAAYGTNLPAADKSALLEYLKTF